MRPRTTQVVGVWVEAEGPRRPLESETSIGALFKWAVDMGITDIYLQIYQGGRAWYASSRVPCAVARFDPVEAALQRAGEKGIRVHAWINAFNLGAGCDADEARLEPLLGQDGKIASTSSALDTPGNWVEPGAKSVFDHTISLVREIFSHYPGLNGLHLDYFRYPYGIPLRPASFVDAGADFGYGLAESFRRTCDAEPFMKNARGDLVTRDYQTALRWDDFRRSKVEAYLPAIRPILKTGQRLSVAALPWIDRAYLSAYQDWPGWLERGLVDDALIMSYTGDDRQFERIQRQALLFKREGGRIISGVGRYRLKSDAHLREQMVIAEQAGTDGACIFSYGGM